MIFTCAAATYDTEGATLFLVRMLGADHLESLYVTPGGRWFGLVSCIGDDLEREYELVPYGTQENVEEAWADDVPLDGPTIWDAA